LPGVAPAHHVAHRLALVVPKRQAMFSACLASRRRESGFGRSPGRKTRTAAEERHRTAGPSSGSGREEPPKS